MLGNDAANLSEPLLDDCPHEFQHLPSSSRDNPTSSTAALENDNIHHANGDCADQDNCSIRAGDGEDGEIDNNSIVVTSLDLIRGETRVEGEPEFLEPSPRQRVGTISSARFNIWSTMVGGGSLSLPLAFSKTGNALLGPLILIITAILTEFCFRIHVHSARLLNAPHATHPSKDSYESIAAAAFGKGMYRFGTILVILMCFFGIVAYAVLLRDMLKPLTDSIFPHSASSATVHNINPSWHDNVTMLTVIFAVTPLCTLQTLTSLQKFGAASMCSIGILGTCILFRSLQCTFSRTEYAPFDHHWWDGFHLLPDSSTWKKDILDVLPLYISCYVCHYNILPVHNELARPSRSRVRRWLRSTVWGSTAFYATLGIAGSAYAPCTATGKLHGNILLDFPEDDPLVFVGRMCLAVTITLAFPMLTIPARDILLRFMKLNSSLIHDSVENDASSSVRNTTEIGISTYSAGVVALRAALLEDAADLDVVEQQQAVQATSEQEVTQLLSNNVGDAGEQASIPSSSESGPVAMSTTFGTRLLASIVVLWSAAALASCVASIDIVWDLLGSSLSIILSYLIPCGSFIFISKKELGEVGHRSRKNRIATFVAWVLVLFFIPLMFISTANAVYNTFFR